MYLKPVQIKTACLQPEKVALDGVRRFRSWRGAPREGSAFWSAATGRRFSLQARSLLFRSSIAAERKAATSRRTPEFPLIYAQASCISRKGTRNAKKKFPSTIACLSTQVNCPTSC
jgi:hypothetical protein